jgi:hypothetical protein
MYYGQLTVLSRSEIPEVRGEYRIDHYRRLVTDRLERDQLRARVYGTWNHVHDSNPYFNERLAIHHSMRLKTHCEAQQLIECLNLLKASRGWNQAEMSRFLSHYVNFRGYIQEDGEHDARTSSCENVPPLVIERVQTRNCGRDCVKFRPSLTRVTQV